MTHVLVTRPLQAAQELAELLVTQGLFPILMPMYAFTSRDPEIEMNTAWSASGCRKLAVFTSPRAVQFGLSHLPQAHMNELEFAVIGPATGAELKSHGFTVYLQARNGHKSEDFLQIPELTSEPGEAVIFCAPGGRESMEMGLQDLGWQVTKAMVYERIPQALNSEQLDTLTAANDLLSVWTSVSALEIAEDSLPAALWSKVLDAPALVVSDRINRHLKQMGASSVELADGPGNPDLLQSILRLSGQHSAILR